MKNSYKIGLAILLAASSVFAGDPVGLDSGVSKAYSPSRWSLSKVGVSTPTMSATATGVTNVVQAVPGLIGRIVFVPGASTDTLKIYNTTTAAGVTDSLLIFDTAVSDPSNGGTFIAGVPQIFDFGNGLPCSTGIVTVIGRAATGTASKAYITYDILR